MQARRAIEMLNASERPLIVAGGGVINADASDLLAEFAELTGVPVIPTLMGWCTIPDDYDLMAGMVGLQTSHRCGNALPSSPPSCSALATAGPIGRRIDELGYDGWIGCEYKPRMTTKAGLRLAADLST